MEVRFLISEFKRLLNRLVYLNEVYDADLDLDYYQDSTAIITVDDYQNAIYEMNELIENIER